MNIAIIGTGAYGMALASVFYNNKCKIKMWTNSEEEKNILLKNGKSDKVDFMIPRDIVISTDMKDVVDSAELIMIAIPAKFLDVSILAFSRLVTNAAAVSKDVRHVHPVSMAFRRIRKPSLLLSRPCVGVSITRSTSPARIRSSAFGEPAEIFLILMAGMPFSMSLSAVLRVA